MIDEGLKKRLVVILNMTLSTFSARDEWYHNDLISQISMTLNGSKLDSYIKKTDFPEFIRQVRTVMYITEISVNDMIQVLDSLQDMWRH